MSSENIYPVIKTEEATEQMIDKALNNSRIKEMLNQRDALVKDLKHYTKLNKRWKRVDLWFKLTGVIIIGATGISAAIAGTVIAPGLLIPVLYPAVPIVLGVLSGTESIILSGIVMGLTGRKKTKYDKKCKIIQSYLDKMFYYIEKARDDNIITFQELEGFRTIVELYKKEIDSNNTEHDTNILDIKDIRKAKIEADKVVKELLKKDLTAEYVQSQYNAVTHIPKVRKILE